MYLMDFVIFCLRRETFIYNVISYYNKGGLKKMKLVLYKILGTDRYQVIGWDVNVTGTLKEIKNRVLDDSSIDGFEIIDPENGNRTILLERNKGTKHV